jgi:predicted nucleic acid-binding protein
LFVVDTHALIWHLTGDNQLGDTARQILGQADNGDVNVVIPTIVLAEAIFISENTGASFHDLLEKVESGSNYEAYPLNMKVIKQMGDLEKDYSIHDKAIVATAEVLEATTITNDKEIRRGDSETVW